MIDGQKDLETPSVKAPLAGAAKATSMEWVRNAFVGP